MSETTAGAVDPRTQTATDRDALLFDFGVDSFKLGTEHIKYLQDTIKFLEDPSTGPMTVSIDGFASHTGTARHNLILSENREREVENFLRAHTNVFDPGQPHTINRNFNGFTGSPPGENPRFRSVRVVVHKPGVVPPPVPVTPVPTVPPAARTLGKFEVDLIGWIPQPEVDNPLSLLPSAITSLLPPGMADPFFGGDNFVTPLSSPTATVSAHTFRATQHFDFTISTFGSAPVPGTKAATPGTTTCLDKRRSVGGKVTFSLPATLLRHEEKVTFSASDDWYEVALSGVVLDPVPAAAAKTLTAKLPGIPHILRAPLSKAISDLATKATPSLTWDAKLRLQRDRRLPRQLN
jgi:hypothetical protein